jgi:methyl-accepting chemotaxis protein
MLKLDNQTLLLAFVAVTGVAVLLQTLILFAIYRAISTATRSLGEQVEDLRSAMMPVIYNTRDLFARMTPKLESTVDDLSQIAQGLKVQTAEAQEAIADVLDRMRKQTSRIDEMITGMLSSLDRAGVFVTEVVSKPARQINSVMATVKAVLDSLRMPVPPRH